MTLSQTAAVRAASDYIKKRRKNGLTIYEHDINVRIWEMLKDTEWNPHRKSFFILCRKVRKKAFAKASQPFRKNMNRKRMHRKAAGKCEVRP